MKKLLLTTTEAYGKEIKNTISSYDTDKLIINFTDDTFLLLEILADYDDGPEIKAATEFYYVDFFENKLVKNGIINEEELKEIHTKATKVHQENRRRQYENLKEEFEPETKIGGKLK